MLLQLLDYFPPEKGTPTRLQPVKARAFVVCTLLKLHVYVSKTNYTDASHHIHLARPSRNVFTIPPKAAGGFGALLNFYEQRIGYRRILQRDYLAAPPFIPSALQQTPDDGPGDMDKILPALSAEHPSTRASTSAAAPSRPKRAKSSAPAEPLPLQLVLKL